MAFLRQLAVPGDIINESTACQRERLHVEQLLDAFECRSSNGTHQVLVLEPMGRTLEHYLTFVEAPDQLVFLREAVKQIIQGLAFIHEKGIVHRDELHRYSWSLLLQAWLKLYQPNLQTFNQAMFFSVFLMGSSIANSLSL